MIMGVVIDAIAPRASPAVAVKQLFEDRRRIQARRSRNGALVDDQWPSRMIGNEPVILEPEGLGRAFLTKPCGSLGRLRPVAFSATRLIVSGKIIARSNQPRLRNC